METKVREAGIEDVKIGTHSLGVGGATAYAGSPAGGELTAAFMGLWASDARLQYLHAFGDALEDAGLAIGKEEGGRLAETPGAVGKYATGRRR